VIASPADACDLLLDEHNLQPCADPRHRRAIADRLNQAEPWQIIKRTKDRDYLAGQPIHCGTTLELQELTYRSDDYGEYSVRLATGTRVRYELAWPSPAAAHKPGCNPEQGCVVSCPVAAPEFKKIVLYTSVGGHEFSSPAEQWMRFRWPVKR